MLLSEVLKEKTNANHDRLEMQMHVNQIFTRRLSFSQYCELIQINYAVIAAIESDIFSALPDDLQQRLEIENRKKLSFLQKDLDALRLHKTVMAHPQKPLYANTAQALGGMYVMEGATLGGNVIARRLKENPELEDQPFYFYNIYGDEIGSRWKIFKDVLDSSVQLEDFEQAIAKANETFDFYHKVAVNMMSEVV